MNKGKFTKGQTIYYACTQFAENCERFQSGADSTLQVEMRVVARVVDSCGAKKVTFLDRGHDSVFGRSASANHEGLFADSADAFDYLDKTAAEIASHGRKTPVINPTVIGDDEWVEPLFATKQA